MLNQFIANIKSVGLSKTNHYKVIITPPAALLANNSLATSIQATGNKIQLMCESTNTPGRSISTSQIRGHGVPREAPNDISFEAFSMTALIDNTHDIRHMFEDWLDLICDPRVRNYSYYNQYTANIELHLLDSVNGFNTDKSRFVFYLKEAYPKSIGEAMLSYTSNDVLRLPINLAYKYYVRTDHNVAPVPPATNNPGSNPDGGAETFPLPSTDITRLFQVVQIYK